MAVDANAMPPATTAMAASGYCTMRKGTVPANTSGRSVAISFSPLWVYLTLDTAKTTTARIDDNRIALSKSPTASSSAAAMKHSADTASLSCSTLRSTSQMTARAATMINAKVIRIR